MIYLELPPSTTTILVSLHPHHHHHHRLYLHLCSRATPSSPTPMFSTFTCVLGAPLSSLASVCSRLAEQNVRQTRAFVYRSVGRSECRRGRSSKGGKASVKYLLHPHHRPTQPTPSSLPPNPLPSSRSLPLTPHIFLPFLFILIPLPIFPLSPQTKFVWS